MYKQLNERMSAGAGGGIAGTESSGARVDTQLEIYLKIIYMYRLEETTVETAPSFTSYQLYTDSEG